MADQAQADWTLPPNNEEEDDDGPIPARSTRASTRAVNSKDLFEAGKKAYETDIGNTATGSSQADETGEHGGHGSGAQGENGTPNPKAGDEDSVMVAKSPAGKDPHFPISCLYSSSSFSNYA